MKDKWQVEIVTGQMAVSQRLPKSDFVSALHAMGKIIENLHIDEVKITSVKITEAE